MTKCNDQYSTYMTGRVVQHIRHVYIGANRVETQFRVDLVKAV